MKKIFFHRSFSYKEDGRSLLLSCYNKYRVGVAREKKKKNKNRLLCDIKLTRDAIGIVKPVPDRLENRQVIIKLVLRLIQQDALTNAEFLFKCRRNLTP